MDEWMDGISTPRPIGLSENVMEKGRREEEEGSFSLGYIIKQDCILSEGPMPPHGIFCT